MSYFNYLSTKQRSALLLVLSFLLVVVPLAFAARVVESRSTRADDTAPLEHADFVREVSVTTKDVAYSTSTGKLYASVPSSAGSIGNRIATINPVTGNVDNSVFIGSEPNLLAISEDGNSLYVSLEGVFAIRRFDTQTDTPGAQFSTGVASSYRRYLVNDFVVAPGNPNVIAIARQYSSTSPPEAGVAIFDNGVQRPVTGPDHTAGSDYVSFSASAAKLYGCGNYSSLKTMAVDASGVTVTATAPFSVAPSIKFNNGLIFSSSGQVINPDTPAQLGKFAGVSTNAFVADSSVGRAFYAGGDQFSGSLTIQAFDINTFLLVGTVTVPGAYGVPTALIRWGANGLALRTSQNQLFLIQTSLIPSGTPIPTPTPTPVATPTPSPATFATFVRQVPLPTNDLVYDQPTQRLYASVPSSVGSNGNSITPIDPTNGVPGNSVFVGSEPTKLAQADDGQTMYVGLDGAGAVRQFNTATQTAGLQFSLGRNNSYGPYRLSDLAVAPGNPQTVAVSRQLTSVSPSAAGVVIFDNGVQRPNSSPNSYNGSALLAFSNSASTLYGTYPNVTTMTLDVTGITGSTTQAFDGGSSIKFVNGLLYGASGQVINPATGELKGTFTGLDSSIYAPLMAVDAANGRVFFLTSENSNGRLRAYDINTFVPLGSVVIPGATGFSVTSMVRWGTNGIAFRSNTKVFIVQSELVNAADPVPAATPTPSPTPSPTPVTAFVQKIELAANDIVYSQATQQLYASIPSIGGANGNSIARINPETASVAQSVFIGSEPNKLAISGDGQTIYTNLDGASALRRFDVPTQTAGLQFSISAPFPPDIEVLPGNSNAVVISTGSGNGVVIYDNGVARPNKGNGGYYAVGPIEFGATSSTLYGYDSYSSGFELIKFSVDASGATTTAGGLTNNLIIGYLTALKFSNGLLYSGSGRIVDPETQTLIGTLQVNGGSVAMAVDQANGRAFYIYNSGSGMTLIAFDIHTFRPLGSVVLPGISGSPGSLVRWGLNGLAFNTVSPSTPSISKIYLVQSTLVSSSGSLPSGVQLNQTTHTISESAGNLVVGVSRTGDVSAPLSVDYATSNGTATAGSDYSSTSGTLNFAAGEASKTITVPIINDTLYEAANETFTLTLSNPTNGALLSNPSTVVTITDNDPKPSLTIASSLRSAEGNSGTSVFSVNVTLSNPTVQQVTVKYATQDGTAADGSDYVATSGTLTFSPGTTSLPVEVTVNGDAVIEPDETFVINLSNATNVASVSNSQAVVTVANDDSSIQLLASGYSIVESSNSLVVSVTRAGDLSSPAAVNYATSDSAGANGCGAITGAASSRCDYLSTLGILKFAAGQSSTTISIPIVDDAYAEGSETFVLELSNPSVGFLGSTPTATITITDNETVNGTNPIDQANFFVRLHYLDFLNREPDADGLAYWSNQITECQQPGATCDPEVRRVNVSAAFFLSIEFQETGFLIERIYKTSFGDADALSALDTYPSQHPIKAPIVRYTEFLADSQQISKDVMVGIGNWQGQLEANKVAFTQDFVTRSRFVTAFPTTLTPAEFVDKLFLNAGVTPTAAERSSIINEFGGAGTSANTTARARALRRVAENPTLNQAETNKAFVLMQYFGYLRRDPNAAPDTDHTGYDFWLHKLDQFNGNYINAEMVRAFISSIEYRQRFAP